MRSIWWNTDEKKKEVTNDKDQHSGNKGGVWDQCSTKSSVVGSDHFAGANKAWATYFHSFIDNILAKHAALHPRHNIAVKIPKCKYNTVSLHSIGVKCSMDRWTWNKKSPWDVRVFFIQSHHSKCGTCKIMGQFPSKGCIASLFNHPFPAASTPLVPSISIPAWPLYAWHILEVNS
jgi:hypothetical protein